jgi:hypothetical protein
MRVAICLGRFEAHQTICFDTPVRVTGACRYRDFSDYRVYQDLARPLGDVSAC